MRIGIMLRDIGNQSDAPGIIIMNLVDKMIELDRANEYVLFLPNSTFIDRYASWSNVKSVIVKAPAKIIWDQIAMPWFAMREKLDVLFHPKHSIPLLSFCKSVMHLRGADYWIMPEHFERLDLIYQKIFLPLCCRKSTHLIAESHDVAQDFQRFITIPDEKMSIIYLAANDRFKVIADEDQLQASRNKFNLPERFILTVTRVIEGKRYYAGKNLPNILEGYRHSEARKTLKFVIIGVQTKDFIHRHLDADDDLLKDLILLDFVPQPELPALCNMAEFFMFPSSYESFGLPILEAMSCGCPVITSKTYSCPEVAGDAGILVDPANVQEISEAVDRLAFDEPFRKQLKQKSLEQASKFSWHQSALQTIKVFEELQQ